VPPPVSTVVYNVYAAARRPIDFDRVTSILTINMSAEVAGEYSCTQLRQMLRYVESAGGGSLATHCLRVNHVVPPALIAAPSLLGIGTPKFGPCSKRPSSSSSVLLTNSPGTLRHAEGFPPLRHARLCLRPFPIEGVPPLSGRVSGGRIHRPLTR
jgi:hypothetical protein